MLCFLFPLLTGTLAFQSQIFLLNQFRLLFYFPLSYLFYFISIHSSRNLPHLSFCYKFFIAPFLLSFNPNWNTIESDTRFVWQKENQTQQWNTQLRTEQWKNYVYSSGKSCILIRVCISSRILLLPIQH